MGKLDSELRPTREVKTATRMAVDEYTTYTDFGNPLDGGYEDQPAEWVESMACVKAAWNKAKSEIEADIQRKQKEAQKKANGKKR